MQSTALTAEDISIKFKPYSVNLMKKKKRRQKTAHFNKTVGCEGKSFTLPFNYI